MSSLSETQQRALAVMPKVTGWLSLSSSVTIIVMIWKDTRQKGKSTTTYQRILLGMSIADISSSFWLSLSTWPIPKDSGLLWAVGSETSCTAQGFFTQFGISSPLYNISLSIYYVLVVRHSWKEDRLRNIEFLLHAIPFLWGTGTALAGIFLDMFGSANLWCWIAMPEEPDRANIYRWSFFYGPLWCAILIVSINLALVFAHVRKITLRSEQYTQESRFGPVAVSLNDNIGKDPQPSQINQVDNPTTITNPVSNDGASSLASPRKSRKAMFSSFRGNDTSEVIEPTTFRNRRRQVSLQCLRYACAFYLTWMPITIVRIMQTVGSSSVFGLLLWAAVATPCQGLPNFCVYLYPKYVAKLEQRLVASQEQQGTTATSNR